jgi:hypothetical protein
MEGGDISNEVSPRLLFVFENLLGLLPTKDHVAKVDKYFRRKRYAKAVEVFEPNETLANRIWDMTWRLKHTIDVVTWIPGPFHHYVQQWIDDQDLPIAHVTHENPTTFARKLSYMPHVAAIFDPDPSHQFTWGHKGRILAPHTDPMTVL